jgi:hypothetical protein
MYNTPASKPSKKNSSPNTRPKSNSKSKGTGQKKKGDAMTRYLNPSKPKDYIDLDMDMQG